MGSHDSPLCGQDIDADCLSEVACLRLEGVPKKYCHHYHPLSSTNSTHPSKHHTHKNFWVFFSLPQAFPTVHLTWPLTNYVGLYILNWLHRQKSIGLASDNHLSTRRPDWANKSTLHLSTTDDTLFPSITAAWHFKRQPIVTPQVMICNYSVCKPQTCRRNFRRGRMIDGSTSTPPPTHLML